MHLNVIILIPRIDLTGPSRGAVALANQLCDNFSVSLISLKPNVNNTYKIDSRVTIIHLNENKYNFVLTISKYLKLLKTKFNPNKTITISYCLSADLLNLFSFNCYKICSLRGNLPLIYLYDYGSTSYILSYIHLFLLNFFDDVIVMSSSMKNQVSKYLFTLPFIINNFISETNYQKKCTNKNTDNIIRLVFVGSLSERKKPLLLVDSFLNLLKFNYKIELHLIGSGKYFKFIKQFVNDNNLSDKIFLYGNLLNPIEQLHKYDIFVLPSLSEGTPRAALEALHIGLPCILRDIDGNSELIEIGYNGDLFKSDTDLFNVLRNFISNFIKSEEKHSLLPAKFHKINCIKNYNKLLNL